MAGQKGRDPGFKPVGLDAGHDTAPEPTAGEPRTKRAQRHRIGHKVINVRKRNLEVIPKRSVTGTDQPTKGLKLAGLERADRGQNALMLRRTVSSSAPERLGQIRQRLDL
jgi:hypothetical protein